MTPMEAEAYIVSRGWQRRHMDLGWWTDPTCRIADFTLEHALRMQQRRDAERAA